MKLVAAYIPADMAQRVEKLADRLAADYGKRNRSHVLRRVIKNGVQVLEDAIRREDEA